MSLDHGGHGGGGHGGGHSGGGGHRGGYSGGRGYGGAFRSDYIVEEPPPMPVESCSDPIPMTASLAAAGQQAFEQSGTYPAHGYMGDVLYAFTVQGGRLVARACSESGAIGDPPPLPTLVSKPQPTGTPIYEVGSEVLARALRAASREFEREIKSVSGTINEPWTPDPTGTSVKSLETPGYLRGDGDLLPFLPGLAKMLGMPPPEAAKLLTALGYAASLAGVRAFQTALNLPATGTVDAGTMAALILAAKAAGLGEPWAPDPTGTSVKSLETPGYLRDPPVVVHPAYPETQPVDAPPLDPERYPTVAKVMT